MKKRVLVSLLIGSIISITSIALAEESLPKHSPPLSEILKNLQEKGYKNIYKIEMNEGAYEVDAVSLFGTETDMRVNPYNGEILESHLGIAHKWSKVHFFGLSALQAAQNVEAMGYHSIYKIEAKDDKYQVKALNATDNATVLEVNTKNGEIKKEWFWK